MSAKDDAVAKAKAEAEAKAKAANPDNITTADKNAVDLAAATLKKQNEDSLQEAKERDANKPDEKRADDAGADSGGAPRNATRHWTSEGGDVVTFDDDAPL